MFHDTSMSRTSYACQGCHNAQEKVGIETGRMDGYLIAFYFLVKTKKYMAASFGIFLTKHKYVRLFL